MTLLQEETFTKQSHSAPLWSIFALFRSKGQISDSLIFKEKKNKAWDKSAGQAECFQIANSVLSFGLLESWGFSTIAVLQSSNPERVQLHSPDSGPSFTSIYQVWGILQVPSTFCSIIFLHFMESTTKKKHLGCPQMNCSRSDHPPPGQGREEYWLVKSVLRPYSLSSAQGWRFCRAYREELWAHSGSDTADSLRDFWRADCCSCRMRRLACWRSASLSSAVCLLKEDRRQWKGVQ